MSRTRTRTLIGNGGWFDPSKSICFEEDSFWNGNNHISRATGSQWDHQELYYTRSGNWVLHSWSQWQGAVPSYETVDNGIAIDWLISQHATDQDDYAKLPQAFRDLVDQAIASSEV